MLVKDGAAKLLCSLLQPPRFAPLKLWVLVRCARLLLC